MKIPTAPPRDCTAEAHEPLAYTLREAARINGLSVATLRRHRKRGALECLRAGGRRLVDARSLRRLLGC